MEVRLGNKTYSVQEGWVSRWDLLSNYREDVGDNRIVVPSSAGITQRQMEHWIELNKIMTGNSKEKIRIDEIIRPTQYFIPSSGVYLGYVDFSSQPLLQRVKLTRELGGWRRDVEVQQLVAHDSLIISEDPYPHLKILAEKLEESDVVLSGIVGELAVLARKIPIDFLYGLHTISRRGWRLMPWRDAYAGYDLLKDEWKSTCAEFLSYYVDHRDLLSKMESIDHTRLTESVAHIPVLRPSNLIRIFADKELLEPIDTGLTLARLIDSDEVTTDDEIMLSLDEYASTRVMPDLLEYEPMVVEVIAIPKGRWTRSYYATALPPEIDDEFTDIRTRYGEVRPLIQDVDSYYARLYEYAEKHPSWTALRAIFSGIALFMMGLTDVKPEKSLSSIPIVLDCLDPLTTYGMADPMRELVDSISQTLGSNCLTAMSACIIGAMEQESIVDYVNTNMRDSAEDAGLSVVEVGRKYMLQFSEYALEAIESGGGTKTIKWPILEV